MGPRYGGANFYPLENEVVCGRNREFESLAPGFGHKGGKMRWALGFLIIALIAGVLGFTGLAVAAAGIAKILFVIFLVLFLASLVGHLFRRA
jgi:uncharacterized membrane protein YtjA (UPF0391 family)